MTAAGIAAAAADNYTGFREPTAAAAEAPAAGGTVFMSQTAVDGSSSRFPPATDHPAAGAAGGGFGGPGYDGVRSGSNDMQPTSEQAAAAGAVASEADGLSAGGEVMGAAAWNDQALTGIFYMTCGTAGTLLMSKE